MSVHTHTMRNWCATAMAMVPVPLLLGLGSVPASQDLKLARVSGRVTCADRPFSGMIYFLPDDQRRAHAMGFVNPDGSFQLYINGLKDQCGAMPGRYRVVLRPHASDKLGSRVDSKYLDSRTSDLLVHVEPDWNYVRVTLR